MSKASAIAIIPARGGSKRIPRKNIKPFAGKPMIAWSIEAAKSSGLFDRILVSTDDAEIAKVATQYGAEVPFERPAQHSNDFAPLQDVLRHALEWLKSNGGAPEQFCCICATAPLIQVSDLKTGSALIKQGAPAAFSVTTFPSTIYRALQVSPDQKLSMIWPENELKRSNDLPEAYHDAAQFYWFKTDAFLNSKSFWSVGASAVVIPRLYVQDVDTMEDWEVAEAKAQLLSQIRS